MFLNVCLTFKGTDPIKVHSKNIFKQELTKLQGAAGYRQLNFPLHLLLATS